MTTTDVEPRGTPEPAQVDEGRRRRWGARWRPARPWVALAVISVAGLGLRQLIEPVIRWNSPVDDENQMRVAAALLSGNWLGDWGSQPIPHITLSKGPGYPLFLAIVNHLSVSPRIAAYLVYLLGALFLVLGLRRLVGWRWGTGLYLVLAFNPHVMSVAFSRPYRDQLVAALALAAFGAATYLGLTLRDTGPWSRPRWVGSLLATLTLSGSFGWLAVTRNDSVWVFGACLLVLLNAVIPRGRRLGRRGWVRAGVAAVVVLLPILAAPAAIAAVNESHYGVRLADDYNDGQFKEAMRSWEAVLPTGGDPFMLVNTPQRTAVYAVSPAAREVEPRLEDAKNGWRGWACGWRPATWPACTEYGPFFGWALRDAAYQAGYTTPVRFQEFFARLSAQIDVACSSGGLTCGPKGVSADLPPVHAWSTRTIVSGTANLVYGSVRFEDMLESPQAAVPSNQDELALWESVMPDVGGLAQMINGGVNLETIVQQPVVDLLKHLYTALAVLGIVISILALFSGLLFRHAVGRIALAAFAGWALNIVIVAIVFAATNRQFEGLVPSYTMPGQSFLLIGLVLSSWVGITVGGPRVVKRTRPRRRTEGPDRP